MKAFNRLVIASFKQFSRDNMSLFFTFAFPIVFMVLFGLVYGGNAQTTYQVGVVDQNQSQLSGNIVAALNTVPGFKISKGDLDSKLSQMKDGKLDALIVIPNDFSSTIDADKNSNILVYYDPSQQSSQIILTFIKQVIGETNNGLSNIPVLIGLTEQSINAFNLKYVDYLIPGILAMSILFLGLFGSLPMVQWREKQVLKRFGATPLPKATIVLSQVFYRVIIALFQTIVIILVAYFVFKVNMVGNWFLLFGLVILGILTFVAIGYLTVARPRTTEGAIAIIQLVQFPMLFLSGIFFPIDTMPAFMRPIVDIMPLTYLGDSLRQIMTGSRPDHPLILDVIILFGWFVVASIITVRFFRWE